MRDVEKAGLLKYFLPLMIDFRPGWAGLAAALVFSAAAWGQGGPPGGSIAELLISPNNPNVIFAATPSGAFRSDNRGGSWRVINEGLTTLDVQALAESPDYLYAATLGGGIFRSADGGASWSAINQGLDSLLAQSIAVAPSDPKILYAGTFTATTTTGAVFKSTDGGDTWAAARNGLSDGSYLGIAIHPANPDIVYAANTSASSSNVGFLYRTTDGGTSWRGSQADGVTAVVIDPATPETLFAGTISSIVKSTDGGATFQRLPTQSVRVRDLAIDPSDPQVVYAGTRAFTSAGLISVITSPDGGANWFAASSGLPQAEAFSVAVDPHDSSRIYCGLDASGVFLSTDGAKSWQFSSAGLFAADVRAIAIDPGDSNTAYASVYGGMIFKTTDGGMTWNQARQGLTATNVADLAVAPTSSSTVLASSVNPFTSQFSLGDGAVFRSTDRGGNWTGIATGLPFRRVLPHPTDANTIFLASDSGVFRTTDGQNFSGRSKGLGIDQVTDLVFDPTDSNTLFAVGIDNSLGGYSIYRTTNSGGDWKGLVLVALPLLNVAVDPNNRDRVFMGTSTGVVRSTNRGDAFNNASEGLPVARINSLAIDGRAGSAMYAATFDSTNGIAAIYKSTNRGDNWVESNNGLGNKSVRRLAIDRSQPGVLWAATAGFGVYKTTDSGANWVPAGVAPGEVPMVNEGGVIGAFDFKGGGVAPGAIISIFGQKMGPAAAGVEAQIDPGTGKLRGMLAGVRVLFNGHEAPLFFVRADQINAQVPFEVSGSATAEVVVEYNGVPSAPTVVEVVDAHPELHPNMVNYADSTINTDANRAAKSDTVLLFATGQGLVDPAVETGALAPGAEPFPRPLLNVSVTVGGIPAQVFFAGLAPGFAGLLQINIFVPAGVPSGPNDVVLKIGDKTAQTVRTLYVK